MSIKVRYIYSACVLIETIDLKILCDPWVSEGAYDGSWYHYPPMKNPLETIGPADFIYISHIHPDHYDPRFLKLYLGKYPSAKVLIAPFSNNILSKKMDRNGIAHEIESNISIGKTNIWMVPNERVWHDVDSAIVVQHDGHSVVNMNDNIYNEGQIKKIKNVVPKIEIALLGYAGAGPYPQTYYEVGPELIEKANQKKEQFFERYKKMRDALDPQISIPFAGKYLLGGNLYYLNPFRGVPDAVEVTRFDKNAVVLDDGGKAWIDTQNLQPSSIREQSYSEEEMSAYALKLSHQPMDYMLKYHELDLSAIPFEEILQKAYENGIKWTRNDKDHWFCINLPEQWFVMNSNSENTSCHEKRDVSDIFPRTEIYVDLRYLYGLLNGEYHWSIAEVGSQLLMRRFPDTYDEKVQNFLNFLHI